MCFAEWVVLRVLRNRNHQCSQCSHWIGAHYVHGTKPSMYYCSSHSCSDPASVWCHVLLLQESCTNTNAHGICIWSHLAAACVGVMRRADPLRNHVLKRDQQPQQPQTFETVSSVGIACSSMYGTFGGVDCGLMSREKISNQQPQNTRAQPCRGVNPHSKCSGASKMTVSVGFWSHSFLSPYHFEWLWILKFDVSEHRCSWQLSKGAPSFLRDSKYRRSDRQYMVLIGAHNVTEQNHPCIIVHLTPALIPRQYDAMYCCSKSLAQIQMHMAYAYGHTWLQPALESWGVRTHCETMF